MMSDECKAYERFAESAWTDSPFPIVKNKLIQYIKYRARCSTFVTFMSNLEKHPSHGHLWLQAMNKDPDIKRLVQFSINLWPHQSKDYKLPIIGVGYVNGRNAYPTYEEPPTTFDNVRVVQGPKARGFMVTDDSLGDPMAILKKGHSFVSDSRLESNRLFIPPTQHRMTDRYYTQEDDDDDMQSISADEFHGVEKKKEEDIDYGEYNDFEVDLETDYMQPNIDLDLDRIDDIDYMCDLMTAKIEDGYMSEDEQDMIIPQPIVRIMIKREPPKRPVGRPRKQIIIPEPKVLIKRIDTEDLMQDI